MGADAGRQQGQQVQRSWGTRVPNEIITGKRPAQPGQRDREPWPGGSGGWSAIDTPKAVGSLSAWGSHGRQPWLKKISELFVIRTSLNHVLNFLISKLPFFR